MCRARTEFIFNLATFPLPKLPYGQQHLLLEAIHIIHLGLLPKVPSGSVHQGYVSLTFVTFSVGVWKEGKKTFLIFQLLMALCHGITLWSNNMKYFTSCSSQSCACAIPKRCLLKFSLPLKIFKDNKIFPLILSSEQVSDISDIRSVSVFWCFLILKCRDFMFKEIYFKNCAFFPDIVCNYFCGCIFLNLQ